MSDKVSVGPKIEKKTYAELRELFGNANAGVTWTAEAIPHLYKRALSEIRGRFTEHELKLMIEALNGTILTPMLASQHLLLGVHDSIEMSRLDKKWEVDRVEVLGKITALTSFQRAMLEIWIWRYLDGCESEPVTEGTEFEREHFALLLEEASATAPKKRKR